MPPERPLLTILAKIEYILFFYPVASEKPYLVQKTIPKYDHRYIHYHNFYYISWPQKGLYPDLLATSGDYLRVWHQSADGEARMACLLNNNKNSDFCAPLTSFDWNEVDPNLIGTSSIDTTCTIWGLETGQVGVLLDLWVDFFTMDCALITIDSNSDSREKLCLNREWNNVLQNK